MDNAQLRHWKQLANDAVIATFGLDNREARLAAALEQAVEAIDDYDAMVDAMVDKVTTLEEEIGELEIRTSDLTTIHAELKEHFADVESSVTAIENALWEDRDTEIDELKDHLKKLAVDIKELGDEL